MSLKKRISCVLAFLKILSSRHFLNLWSIYDLLQARQQTRQQELEALKLKTEQESVDAVRRLQEDRCKAADGAQEAARLFTSETATVTATLHESSRKLAQTQAEAAQLTANAAKQLAEVQSAFIFHY